MKRVLELEAHHPPLIQHLSNGGGKMTRLSPSSIPTNNNNNTLATINNLINASALNLAPPNPMLLSRLVLPPRPSPGGSETPPPQHDRDQEDADFSDEDDEGPKDFRGEVPSTPVLAYYCLIIVLLLAALCLYLGIIILIIIINAA